MGKKRKAVAAAVPQGGWPTRDSLDKFVKVVSGVIPLLDSIRESLEESTGSIPKASQQLDNVTRATESATVEILDVLERMSGRVRTLGEALAVGRASADAEAGRLADLDGLMASLASTRPDILERWKEYRAAPCGTCLPAGLDAEFGAISADAMSIGMALQVQDITTQQIAGVSHMIESVRMKLAEVLQSLMDGENPPPAVPAAAAPGGHFDADAEYSHSPDRQVSTDEIVERWKRGHNG